MDGNCISLSSRKIINNYKYALLIFFNIFDIHLFKLSLKNIIIHIRLAYIQFKTKF
jgi:hypothetical protein